MVDYQDILDEEPRRLDSYHRSHIDPYACWKCKHWKDGGTCAAFPEGVPQAIVNGWTPHNKPIEGDHGIQFEALDEWK